MRDRTSGSLTSSISVNPQLANIVDRVLRQDYRDHRRRSQMLNSRTWHQCDCSSS